MGLFFSGASRDGFPVTIVTSPSSGISAANTGHPAVAGQQVRGLKSGLCDGLGPDDSDAPELRPRMSGKVGGGSLAPASPTCNTTARPGQGRSIYVYGARVPFQCGRATAVSIGAVVWAWLWRPRRCPWRRPGRCPARSARDSGGCFAMGSLPVVPGHRPHAQEQSPLRSAPYFGLNARSWGASKFIPKPSCGSGALAWGLDPRCSGRRLFLYRGFKFVLLFWSTVIAQRFGFANMKSDAHLDFKVRN